METVKLLLVEDNPVDVLQLKEELRQSERVNFAISHVQTLREAKTRLAREDFDVLVLDLGLSDSNGLETFVAIKDANPNVPIVVMSGLADEIVAGEAVRQGAQDYVVKGTWNGDTVRRSIRYAIERHRLVSQVRRGEEALRQSEERFRAIFDGASDAIWIKDRKLRTTHVNPAMARILQRSPEALEGLEAGSLLGDESARMRETDIRVLTGETIEEERTFAIDGVKSTWNIVKIPLRQSSRDIDGLCGIAREVTDRRRTESKPHPAHENYPSKAMRSALRQARLVARGESSILLLGESGSGKDYLAKYIHDNSLRAHGPYFAINCAAIPAELAESELFGYAKGAFTGAATRKRGLLELAEGGTLLLNEIGELPLPLQAKLLTFLDTKKFTRVGGESETSVNARILAATNRDLEKEVESGGFRKDLFYRLNVMVISVPPLRERLEDIPMLVRDTLEHLCRELQIHKMPTVDSATIHTLKQYEWPGNVRELRNVLERALMLSGGKCLDLGHPQLECFADPSLSDTGLTISFPECGFLQEATDQLTRAFCVEALKRTRGNKKTAARILGISRDTLYRHLQKFGLDQSE